MLKKVLQVCPSQSVPVISISMHKGSFWYIIADRLQHHHPKELTSFNMPPVQTLTCQFYNILTCPATSFRLFKSLTWMFLSCRYSHGTSPKHKWITSRHSSKHVGSCISPSYQFQHANINFYALLTCMTACPISTQKLGTILFKWFLTHKLHSVSLD